MFPRCSFSINITWTVAGGEYSESFEAQFFAPRETAASDAFCTLQHESGDFCRHSSLCRYFIDELGAIHITFILFHHKNTGSCNTRQ